MLALTGLAAGGLLYTFAPAKQEPSLQGKWKVVSAPKDWKIAPGTNVNVTGDEIQVRLGPVTGSTFQYAADFSSGHIQATKAGERSRLGKFALNGETVTIVVGPPGGARPDLDAEEESGILRWVFRRSR